MCRALYNRYTVYVLPCALLAPALLTTATLPPHDPCWWRRCVAASCAALVGVGPRTSSRYDIGSPAFTDVWVSSTGSDAATGTSRAAALRTVAEAWRRIPPSSTLTVGVRINIVAGEIPWEACDVRCSDCAH